MLGCKGLRDLDLYNLHDARRVDEPQGLCNSLPTSFVLSLVYSEKCPLTPLSTSSPQLVKNLPTILNFLISGK